MFAFFEKLLHPNRPTGPRVDTAQMSGVHIQARMEDTAHRQEIRRFLSQREVSRFMDTRKLA